ncbi:MAG TPA: LuxR C-terminal-related transcriptional regulator [Anaerolineales bacterium]|nr:LuxR C-terminal-related transcriptional regulator [Anaerolineales bacterium]
MFDNSVPIQSAEGLTERERELLRLVATGASNKEIATQLFISVNTVKVHLRNIFTKIGVLSRTEATLWAIEHKIVEAPGGDSKESAEQALLALQAQLAELEELTEQQKQEMLARLEQERQQWAETAEQVRHAQQSAEKTAQAEQSARLQAEARASAEQSARRKFVRQLLVVAVAVLLLVGIMTGYALWSAQQATQRTNQAVSALQTAEAERWSKLPALPVEIRQPLLAYAPNQQGIYVLETSPTTESANVHVLRYDNNGSAWLPMPNLPATIAAGSAYALNNQLFVASQNAHWVFDPATQAWSTADSLPQLQGEPRVAVASGTVWLLDRASGEIWRKGNEDWQVMGQLPDGQVATQWVSDGSHLLYFALQNAESGEVYQTVAGDDLDWQLLQGDLPATTQISALANELYLAYPNAEGLTLQAIRLSDAQKVGETHLRGVFSQAGQLLASDSQVVWFSPDGIWAWKRFYALFLPVVGG